MKTNSIHTHLKSAEKDFALPDDLTRLVPGTELVRRTAEAVQTFLWSNKSGGTTIILSKFNPRVLLTLLTYSYATGLFASASIVKQCEGEDTFRYLSRGIKFAPDRIRLFRGQNSVLVKRCLAFVIRHVYNRHLPANQDPRPKDNTETVPDKTGCVALLNTALSQRDAERRFNCAVQTDHTGVVASVLEDLFGPRDTGVASTV